MNIIVYERSIVIGSPSYYNDANYAFLCALNKEYLASINRNLRDYINKLKILLGTDNIPYVKLKEIGCSEIKEDSLIRFLLPNENILPHYNEILNHNSHTIEVSIEEGNTRVINNSVFDLKIELKTDSEICQIIEDILLDISMFYTYGMDANFNSKTTQNSFSLKKVEFCRDINISPWFANISLCNRYVSFASCARINDKGRIDLQKYKSTWDLFIQNSMRVQSTNISYERICDDIITHYKNGKQLSRTKLLKLLNGLPLGSYSLIRISRKPTSNHAKIMEHLFKGKIRIGKMLIVPITKRYKYAFSEIDIYNFNIL